MKSLKNEKKNWNIYYLAKFHWFLISVYIQATQIYLQEYHHITKSPLEKDILIFHTSSCRLGVALPMFIVSVVV